MGLKINTKQDILPNVFHVVKKQPLTSIVGTKISLCLFLPTILQVIFHLCLTQ